jgi:hypothetical protein
MRVPGCLAALALVLFAPGALAAQQFTHHSQRDPMTDADRSVILNTGENQDPRTPSLGWGCGEEGLRMMIVLGGFMGGDRNRVLVQLRFDDAPALPPAMWEMLSSKKVTHAPPEQVWALTDLAMAASRVTVRLVDPLDRESRVNVFRLNNLGPTIRKLPCYIP